MPWPRVRSPVGMTIALPRCTRTIWASRIPSSGGFTSSSAELMARSGARIRASPGEGS